MRRLLLASIATLISVPAFAVDGKVEIALEGLAYEQTTEKDTPDGGSAVKETETTTRTVPWSSLEIAYIVESMAFRYYPNVGGFTAGGLQIGYRGIEHLEAGLSLYLNMSKTKGEDDTESENSTSYGIYAKYWLPVSTDMHVVFEPSIGMFSSDSKYVNDSTTGDESTTKGSGMYYGLEIKLEHECATNVSYEGGISYSMSTEKYSEEDEPTPELEGKKASSTLSIVPLGVRVRI